MRAQPGQRTLRGFTFIEMLVSLVIILLLMGLLFPYLVRGQEAARRTSCQSNLKQITMALHLYASDNNGRFPPDDDGWVPMMAYTKNFGVLTCPDERDPSRGWVGKVSTPPGGHPILYSSYQYHGGLANDDWSELPVAGDWNPWHQGGGNVAYLGGNVRWVRAREMPRISGDARPRPAPGAPPFQSLPPGY